MADTSIRQLISGNRRYINAFAAGGWLGIALLLCAAFIYLTVASPLMATRLDLGLAQFLVTHPNIAELEFQLPQVRELLFQANLLQLAYIVVDKFNVFFLIPGCTGVLSIWWTNAMNHSKRTQLLGMLGSWLYFAAIAGYVCVSFPGALEPAELVRNTCQYHR
jgi:hypothetical protein